VVGSKSPAMSTTQRWFSSNLYRARSRFGTGKILAGRGGASCAQARSLLGALEFCGLTEGVVNPSYLAFHPSHRFLYAVNELKEFEGAPTGAVSGFALDRIAGS